MGAPREHFAVPRYARLRTRESGNTSQTPVDSGLYSQIRVFSSGRPKAGPRRTCTSGVCARSAFTAPFAPVPSLLRV